MTCINVTVCQTCARSSLFLFLDYIQPSNNLYALPVFLTCVLWRSLHIMRSKLCMFRGYVIMCKIMCTSMVYVSVAWDCVVLCYHSPDVFVYLARGTDFTSQSGQSGCCRVDDIVCVCLLIGSDHFSLYVPL